MISSSTLWSVSRDVGENQPTTIADNTLVCLRLVHSRLFADRDALENFEVKKSISVFNNGDVCPLIR